MNTLIVRTSGKTFDDCLDPLATGVPKECGWPEANHRRVGKGWQASYELTVSQAADMLHHLNTIAEIRLTGSDDPDDKAIGRAIARDADRLRTQLANRPD